MGMGPMTGRGAGFCTGNANSEFSHSIPGRGRGFGRGNCRGNGQGLGSGRGWRNGWINQGDQIANQPVRTPVDELTELKNQANYFGESLQALNSRISELETEKK